MNLMLEQRRQTLRVKRTATSNSYLNDKASKFSNCARAIEHPDCESKFLELGCIEYNGHLNVHSSLLSIILYDRPQSPGVECEQTEGARNCPGLSSVAGLVHSKG